MSALAMSDDTWTIRRILAWMTDDFRGRNLDSPRLDAEVLLSHALGCDRVGLYLDIDRPLVADELCLVRDHVGRRRRREPVAYIVGQREFYGRPFAVGPAVLVPRPDTECLVARALEILPPESTARVLDLCTGSGAIAVSIAVERPLAAVVATDLSADALAFASRNAEALGAAARVTCRLGDLFDAIDGDQRFDLITANPPYIAETEMAALSADIADHEPPLALRAGPAGLDVVARIADRITDHLAPSGRALIEIGAGQATAARALFAGVGAVRLHRDYGGIERVLEVGPDSETPPRRVAAIDDDPVSGPGGIDLASPAAPVPSPTGPPVGDRDAP